MPTTAEEGLRVLLLEDDARDAELVLYALRRAEPASSVRVADTRGSFTHDLETEGPDVVLSDHGAVDIHAIDALRLVQQQHPTVPVILVSGVMEQSATECLKAGAADFVPKAELSRLGPAIRTALALRAPLRRLSARQLTVLQRLAAGNSARQIAGQLGISVKTVESHRSQVMKRLAIFDLAGLVRYAVLVGVVSAGH